MTTSNFEYTIFSGNERTKITVLDLPDELNDWVDVNKSLVIKIQDALSTTHQVLTDDKLWEIIAESSSYDWRNAKKKLNVIEKEWDELNSPGKIPLGLIGDALDSHIMAPVEEQLSISLADFSLINNGLKEREDLSKLLQVFTVVSRIVDNSTETSKNLQQSSNDLNELNISLKSNDQAEIKSSAKIVKLFRHYKNELLRKTRTKSPKVANNEPVL